MLFSCKICGGKQARKLPAIQRCKSGAWIRDRSGVLPYYQNQSTVRRRRVMWEVHASHGQWMAEWLCRGNSRQAFSLQIILKAAEKHLDQAPQFTSPSLTKHCDLLCCSGLEQNGCIANLSLFWECGKLFMYCRESTIKSSSLCRERKHIPVIPNYVGSRNWGSCPYSSWSASYL